MTSPAEAASRLANHTLALERVDHSNIELRKVPLITGGHNQSMHPRRGRDHRIHQ